MAAKLTLTTYLMRRGTTKALTRIEAEAFGIPYPLQSGWPAKFASMEITAEMRQDLKNRIATAKQSTASKARQALKGLTGDELIKVASEPAATTKASETVGIRSTQCPGFVIRQARRYRSQCQFR